MTVRKIGPEIGKHAFIWAVLFFAFFPLYITLSISVKNNKQFNADPFVPLPLSGLTETQEREPASEAAYDPKSITAARDAADLGLKPGDADWPMVRKSTPRT